jgi:hypothetical protein
MNDKDELNDKDEFYIGWMTSAPDGLARHTRKVLLALLILVIVAGSLLAVQQKQFSTGSFEFGQLTEVTGIYQQFPVPAIKVRSQQDAVGHSTYITMPLVGYGKFGAEGVIAALEKENHISLDNKEVSFKGTLLYSDGKTLLQIDGNDATLLKLSRTNSPLSKKHEMKELGTVGLKGEILDPKCYFGVMKPGYGKPHRDCAIRCIEGGMNPVFHAIDAKGVSVYYLILDSNGKKMNDIIKDYIADPVSLEARAVQYDDWVLLYVKGKEKIKRISTISLIKPNDGIVSCTSPH